MAKKDTHSICLNVDMWEYVDKFKDKEGINSRSAAIERIVLLHKMTVNNISPQIEKKEIRKDLEEVSSEINSNIEDSMEDIFKNMPK